MASLDGAEQQGFYRGDFRCRSIRTVGGHIGSNSMVGGRRRPSLPSARGSRNPARRGHDRRDTGHPAPRTNPARSGMNFHHHDSPLWATTNTWDTPDWTVDELIAAKRGRTVSVVLPALN